MKRSTLTVGYFVSLLVAAVVFGWIALSSSRNPSVRTDAGVIGLCNLAYWLFVFYVLRKGEMRTSGSLVTHAEEPKRFALYFFVLVLMGIVAAIVGAGIILSKASRTPL